MIRQISRGAGLLLAVSVLIAGIDGCAGTRQTGVRATRKAEVAILGTYHLANPSTNYVAVRGRDIMSAEVQHELEEAVARLAELHPTKIAVESPFGDAQLSEAYHQYIQGEHRLQPNEREQLGFRLARRLGHPTVYSIDSRQEWNFTDDLKKLREYGQSASADELSAEFARIGTVVNSVVQEKTVREILRFLNGADLQARIHGLYLLLARMGRNEEYPGVESISKWYSRNLRIYVNLTRIIDSPDDRVLVIYGMGHVKLLQQFVSESPDLELVSIEPYL